MPACQPAKRVRQTDRQTAEREGEQERKVTAEGSGVGQSVGEKEGQSCNAKEQKSESYFAGKRRGMTGEIMDLVQPEKCALEHAHVVRQNGLIAV